MSKDPVKDGMVVHIKAEQWVWDGPREEFEEALKKELEYASKDLLVYALEEYDKRKVS